MTSEKKRFAHMNIDCWRLKTFKLMFVVQMKAKLDCEKSSFFLSDSCFASIPESTPLLTDLTLYDNG